MIVVSYKGCKLLGGSSNRGGFQTGNLHKFNGEEFGSDYCPIVFYIVMKDRPFWACQFDL